MSSMSSPVATEPTADDHEQERTPDADADATTRPARTCPECDGRVRVGEIETVCTDCGLVVAETLIDHGPEWRNFDTDERSRSRVGSGRTERRHDHGLGSELRTNDRHDDRTQKLAWLHSATSFQGNGMRNRAHGLEQVRRVGDQLELGDSVIDRACRLWHEAHGNGLAIGGSLEELIGAVLLAAVREQELPVTSAMILERISLPDDRRLHKTYHDVVSATSADPSIAVPMDFVARIADAVDLARERRQEARELLADVQSEQVHVGRKPAGVAAAALYAVAFGRSVEVTQKEVAEAADTSVVTIRSNLDEFADADLIVRNGGVPA